MNAQQQALEYAKQHNSKATGLTDVELAGKMMAQDVVIGRAPNGVTWARITRQGNEMVITETTRATTHEVVDGRVNDVETVSAVEVLRVSL